MGRGGNEVYVKVPIQRCVAETGKPPIKVRWIDINKGDAEKSNYRSRSVAKEIREAHSIDANIFAQTNGNALHKAIMAA